MAAAAFRYPNRPADGHAHACSPGVALILRRPTLASNIRSCQALLTPPAQQKNPDVNAENLWTPTPNALQKVIRHQRSKCPASPAPAISLLAATAGWPGCMRGAGLGAPSSGAAAAVLRRCPSGSLPCDTPAAVLCSHDCGSAGRLLPDDDAGCSADAEGAAPAAMRVAGSAADVAGGEPSSSWARPALGAA